LARSETKALRRSGPKRLYARGTPSCVCPCMFRVYRMLRQFAAGRPSSVDGWSRCDRYFRQTLLAPSTSHRFVGILVAALLPLAAHRGPARTMPEVSARQPQACVDRWNWMNYRGNFAYSVAPTKVEAHPCRIEIAYALPRSEHDYRLYVRSLYFPCSVDRFGAYVCTEHAIGIPGGPPRTGHNARYFPTTGRIRLDHPPSRAVATAKPAWLRRYRVVAGFIVPFDARGRLHAGIHLRVRAGVKTTCNTFANVARRTRLYGCGAGLYCFAPTLPPRDGQRLACPEQRGSVVFDEGVLRVAR
jgi:hypothetical protein